MKGLILIRLPPIWLNFHRPTNSIQPIISYYAGFCIEHLFYGYQIFKYRVFLNKSDKEDSVKSLFIGGEDRYAFVMSQSEGLIQNACRET